jgi:hypothetical protein
VFFLKGIIAMQSPCLYHTTDPILGRLLCFHTSVVDADDIDKVFGWVCKRRHLVAKLRKVWKAVSRAASIRRTAPRQKDDIVE